MYREGRGIPLQEGFTSTENTLSYALQDRIEAFPL